MKLEVTLFVMIVLFGAGSLIYSCNEKQVCRSQACETGLRPVYLDGECVCMSKTKPKEW